MTLRIYKWNPKDQCGSILFPIANHIAGVGPPQGPLEVPGRHFGFENHWSRGAGRAPAVVLVIVQSAALLQQQDNIVAAFVYYIGYIL